MKTFAVCVGLLTAFFITACGHETETTPAQTLTLKLQGTWSSNDPTIYSGSLEIDNDRITITGYDESQTPPPLKGGDDNRRPFKDFTKDTGLKWRSEVITQNKDSIKGKIYITDKGEEQFGIPYTYYEGALWYDSSSSYSYKADKFLSFTFGDREEKLGNSENHH